jgi:SPP1 gp7 family putative phage head morphogenesis protein
MTAALLLASWVAGAELSVRRAGIPAAAVAGVRARFDRGIPDGFDFGFDAGPAAEVVRRFVATVPITKERWEQVIAAARDAARELREAESAEALERILDRSPAIRAVVRPMAAGTAPQGQPPASQLPEAGAGGARRPTAPERNIGVQRVAQGAFFVSGMTQEQVEQTREILAVAVSGEETVSRAGKRLAMLGVGDFIDQTIAETGSDLTTARLETVYRTNLNRAQTQGRLDVCREDIVRRFVPLMRFSSTKDSRTRPTHRAMDGYVATIDQIDAKGIPTPWGFNCRCAWVPMTVGEAHSRGLCDEDGNPDYDAIRKANGAKERLVHTAQVPDPGFIAG